MRVSALASVILVFLLAGCGDDSSGPTDDITVEMRDNSFFPASRTISPNTRIRWVNAGNVQHNTTSTTQVWGSTNLNPGASFSFTFTQAGTFPYSCTLHPGMEGTIVVQ